MRLILCLILFFPLKLAYAGQEWQLIWVTNSYAWHIIEAHGELKRTGNILEGTLNVKPDGRADFRLRIELKENQATGEFEVLSEKDGSSRLSGTYKKWAHSNKHCPEQIQLVNEYEYIGLSRNACTP